MVPYVVNVRNHPNGWTVEVTRLGMHWAWLERRLSRGEKHVRSPGSLEVGRWSRIRRNVRQVTATIIVAALGLISTLAATVLTSHLHRKTASDGRRLDARLDAYAELIAALIEYERATFDRAKASIKGRPNDPERDDKRQEAWRSNARARAAISMVALLSNDLGLRDRLEAIRRDIGEMNRAGPDDLHDKHEQIYRDLDSILVAAKVEVAP